jgi:hypothetical protein
VALLVEVVYVTVGQGGVAVAAPAQPVVTFEHLPPDAGAGAAG